MTDLDRHRPCTRVTDPSDDEDNRQPTRPTPRTTCTENHHAALLADTLPHRTTNVGATTKQSQPVGIWYAARSKEFVWQPHHPVTGPLRHAIRQRLCARVLGLDGRAKPLGGGGERRAVSRKKYEGADTVRHQRRSREDKDVED
jgi:hypothetical protein